MKKILAIASLFAVAGLFVASPVLAAPADNASHIAQCAVEMGGLHVADCAQANTGVSECAQMTGVCEH